jgi:hypothetical protein
MAQKMKLESENRGMPIRRTDAMIAAKRLPKIGFSNLNFSF